MLYFTEFHPPGARPYDRQPPPIGRVGVIDSSRKYHCTISHYNDVIMGAIASQITSLTIVLNRLFWRRSKKTTRIRVTGLCAGNSPVTGEFPAQMASNAENVSIWWDHHAVGVLRITHPSALRNHQSRSLFTNKHWLASTWFSAWISNYTEKAMGFNYSSILQLQWSAGLIYWAKPLLKIGNGWVLNFNIKPFAWLLI